MKKNRIRRCEINDGVISKTYELEVVRRYDCWNV